MLHFLKDTVLSEMIWADISMGNASVFFIYFFITSVVVTFTVRSLHGLQQQSSGSHICADFAFL